MRAGCCGLFVESDKLNRERWKRSRTATSERDLASCEGNLGTASPVSHPHLGILLQESP